MTQRIHRCDTNLFTSGEVIGSMSHLYKFSLVYIENHSKNINYACALV